MIDYVRQEDEILHVGANWERKYTVEDISFDTENTRAVLKIRDRKDNLLCEAECIIEEHDVLAKISYEVTQSIDSKTTKGKYDVFLIVGDKSYKLVMGDIEIIHDVSMH